MLLPAAGPKGFGLALMVDLLCALAGGSNGTEVPSLYGDPALPFDCSWLLLAIDPSHFGLERSYAARVAELAAQAVAGPAAPGAPPCACPATAGSRPPCARTAASRCPQHCWRS